MRTTFPVNGQVPALVVMASRYPLSHGGVGIIRSLGRLGVPVYATTEDRFTPVASSRYVRDSFVWPVTRLDDAEGLVGDLKEMGRKIGRPAVLYTTDDEAAVLVAEHAHDLAEFFLLPTLKDPGLARRLASKEGLHQLCTEFDVPSPAGAAPRSLEEIRSFARSARFPVVAKNREAFQRQQAPAVPGTTVIQGVDELMSLAETWADDPGVVLQEYLPREHAEDWIVHGYFDEQAHPRALFTGVKLRSWPPHAGVTSCAFTVWNPDLAALASEFCRKIGYHGIADLDWRYDRRDGHYKLLDFNPRVGAQFRLFETTRGIDVVRAQYLDLTGQDVPLSEAREARRFIVENLDPQARLAYRNGTYRAPHCPPRASETELAWFARDDLLPFFAMMPRMVVPSVQLVRNKWRERRPSTRRSRR
jgi:D-aspartate ligase